MSADDRMRRTRTRAQILLSQISRTKLPARCIAFVVLDRLVSDRRTQRRRQRLQVEKRALDFCERFVIEPFYIVAFDLGADRGREWQHLYLHGGRPRAVNSAAMIGYRFTSRLVSAHGHTRMEGTLILQARISGETL